MRAASLAAQYAAGLSTISSTNIGISRGVLMEDPAIIRMNLERYRRLLAVETNATKLRTILKLMRETEAKLPDPQLPRTTFPQSGSQSGGCLR